MNRRYISLRRRFETLLCCGFACFYCGAKPPDAALVIEHVIPVARGGDNNDTNLVAACSRCNHGKAARVYAVPGKGSAARVRRTTRRRVELGRVDDGLYERMSDLSLRDGCSVNDIGAYLLLPVDDIDRDFAERVVSIMRRLGWEWYQESFADRFRRPPPPPPPATVLYARIVLPPRPISPFG